MANSYTLFSQELNNLTASELIWLRAQLEFEDLREHEDEDDFTPSLPDWLPEHWPHEYWPDFAWDFEGDTLYLYSEESGNIENVVALVEEFLDLFRPTENWSLEYAQTCSKPRPGEFGGGAVLITPSETYWMNTSTWLLQKENELQGENK